MRPENTSTDPRLQAVTVLARVEANSAHAARLLGGATPAERELVMGTLRWQLTLDRLLERHLRTPIAALDIRVRAVLRVGLYEARRMRTPAPVAVAEAVRLAKAVAPRATGLVNAVLRRAVGETWPGASDAAVPLSVRYSHPAWLVERWRGLLGEQVTEDALAADQEAAPLYLLSAVSALDELTAAGCILRPHPTVSGVVAVEAGVEAAVAALRAGRAYAMDPTAVAVARVLPEVDGTVMDLAAALSAHCGYIFFSRTRPKQLLISPRRRAARAWCSRASARADASWLPTVTLGGPCSCDGTSRSQGARSP